MLSYLVVLFSVLGGCVLGREVIEPLVLTPDNFSETISAYEAIVVDFYAPWCGVCKRVNPEYAEGNTLLLESDETRARAVFAKMDAAEFDVFADAEGVRHYPTFFLYINGSKAEKLSIYQTGAGYVAATRLALGLEGIPPIKDLVDDVMEVSSWLFWRGTDEGRLTSSVVFFDAGDERGRDLSQAFTDLAALNSAKAHLRFARVSGVEVLKTFGLGDGGSQVVLYKEYDEGRDLFDVSLVSSGCAVDGKGEVEECGGGEDVSEKLRKWFERRNTPLVSTATHVTINGIRSHGQALCLVFVTDTSVEDPRVRSKLLDELSEVAKQLEEEGVLDRGEMSFLLTSGQKYWTWMDEIQMPLWELPSAAIEDQSRGHVYHLSLPSSQPVETSEELLRRRVQENSAAADKPQPTPDANGFQPRPPIEADAVHTIDPQAIAQSVRDWKRGKLIPDISGRDKTKSIFDEPPPDSEEDIITSQ